MPTVTRRAVLLALVCSSSASGSANGAHPVQPPRTPPPLEYTAESFSAPPPAVGASPLAELEITAEELDSMVKEALAWAAANALLVHSKEAEAATSAHALTHAPFSLLPASFPAEQLSIARERLAPLFGLLVERVGRDVSWLTETLRGAADGDEFTRRLLDLCALVQREGATQPARLALLRSDYMLHEPEDGSAGSGQLLQVELNTIASSFASLSARVCRLHTALAQRWPCFRRHVWREAGAPGTLSLPAALPPSDAIEELAAGIAEAHALYVSQQAGAGDAARPPPAVLFVVQGGEANRIDQDLLSERLWEAHGIRVVRRTLAEVSRDAALTGPSRVLTLPGADGGGGGGGACDVSVVYFRCGYTPADYPTEAEWAARATLERSRAIKCPCIEHHLVGCKKVQQQLAAPGELERFLSAEDAAECRRSFAGLWSLSGPDSPAEAATPDEAEAAERMRQALAAPEGYVMKPQREGGGHNFFGAELVEALRTLSREERSAYILMQRIMPRQRPAVLVRRGEAVGGGAVSELGVYSTLLTGEGGAVLRNRPAGHLVRTKLEGVDEGGVAAGFAVLSSPLAAAPRGSAPDA